MSMDIISSDIYCFSENRGLMRKVTETALIGSNRATGQVLCAAKVAYNLSSERE